MKRLNMNGNNLNIIQSATEIGKIENLEECQLQKELSNHDIEDNSDNIHKLSETINGDDNKIDFKDNPIKNDIIISSKKDDNKEKTLINEVSLNFSKVMDIDKKSKNDLDNYEIIKDVIHQDINVNNDQNQAINKINIDSKNYLSDKIKETSVNKILGKENKFKGKIDDKEILKTKIKNLEETINVLRSHDNSKDKINQHIGESLKKSRLKEIQQTKVLLENKLNNIEIQIENLILDENNINKFDLRKYLDNFEKDKFKAELFVKKHEIEKNERSRIFKEKQKLSEIRYNSNDNMDNEINRKKKQLDYLKNLEILKEKSDKNHQEIESLRENLKLSYIKEGKYFYQSLEEDFNRKMEKLEEERKKLEYDDYVRRKNLFKPIDKDELDSFSKRYLEERQKILNEMEKERIIKQQELFLSNLSLPKRETIFYFNIIEQDRELKEQFQKMRLEKLYTSMKVRNFSKEINLNYVPKIDENKKKELEELKIKLNDKSVKKHQRKHKRIILIKPKNDKSNEDNIEDSESEEKKYDIPRKPLVNKPDYLTEMRLKKPKDKSNNQDNDKKWNKLINNHKNSLVENIEQIKIRALMIEEKANMKQKYLKYSGGADRNIELGEDICNMKIDSIKAKLTILESISKN